MRKTQARQWEEELLPFADLVSVKVVRGRDGLPTAATAFKDEAVGAVFHALAVDPKNGALTAGQLIEKSMGLLGRVKPKPEKATPKPQVLTDIPEPGERETLAEGEFAYGDQAELPPSLRGAKRK